MTAVGALAQLAEHVVTGQLTLGMEVTAVGALAQPIGTVLVGQPAGQP